MFGLLDTLLLLTRAFGSSIFWNITITKTLVEGITKIADLPPVQLFSLFGNHWQSCQKAVKTCFCKKWCRSSQLINWKYDVETLFLSSEYVTTAKLFNLSHHVYFLSPLLIQSVKHQPCFLGIKDHSGHLILVAFIRKWKS